MSVRAEVLPEKWCNTNLSEIAAVNPTLDKTAIPDDLEVSFVPMPAVEAESGLMDVSNTRKFSEVKKGYTPFREGDVLFAKITPCMENGKMAVVPEVRNGIGFGSTEFHVLRTQPGIDARYVYYYVSSKAFRHVAEHNMTGAVGQRRVPTTYLSGCNIPLPPTNEQRRIVAKIEELFSELDKGIEALKTAREQLKVYRQALLKHAFEGKLTAAWRAANPDQLEPAAALLARIQTEREQRYQQQLQQWEQNKSPSVPLLQRGKTTSAAASAPPFEKGVPGGIDEHPPLKKGGRGDLKPKAPKPLPPLTAEELAELPELPEGWGWVRLGDILSVSSGSGLTSSQMNGGAFPVYGGNGISGYHDEYLFENETLILGRVGAKCGVVHITRPKSWITDNALIVEFLIHSLDQRYLKLRLEYLDLNKHSVSTAQPVISGSKIYPLFIGLPCLQEQIEIANQIESRLSEVDQLDLTITTSLQQTEALRQSILKKAFSGQLVAQDANDEPASVLLARIRAKRESPHPPFAKGGRSRSGGGISAKPHKSTTGDKLSPTEISTVSTSKEP